MINFTYSQRVGNAPFNVDFNDISIGGPYTYRKWVFGDGESVDGNETSVTHEYKAPGVYTVSLVAGTSDTQGQAVKQGLILVNEGIEDARLVVAESKGSDGRYWSFYIDLDGKLVFETEENKKITSEKVALIDRWMFLEYHVVEGKFYVGSYSNGRRHKQHATVRHNPPLESSITGFLRIAPNSSYIIDDLKIWRVDTDLFPYYNSLRGRAGFLDPV